MNHKIKVMWMTWKSILGVSGDPIIPIKLKEQFYKTTIRSATFDGTEFIKKKPIHKLSVAVLPKKKVECS